MWIEKWKMDDESYGSTAYPMALRHGLCSEGWIDYHLTIMHMVKTRWIWRDGWQISKIKLLTTEFYIWTCQINFENRRRLSPGDTNFSKRTNFISHTTRFYLLRQLQRTTIATSVNRIEQMFWLLYGLENGGSDFKDYLYCWMMTC